MAGTTRFNEFDLSDIEFIRWNGGGVFNAGGRGRCGLRILDTDASRTDYTDFHGLFDGVMLRSAVRDEASLPRMDANQRE
jgi:hypothetical protein